ncbi:uncharacterized protein [Typha angustifolia]|uniref:uncharacterized protein isoform X2 n=1 Tax=Typha angustifolia TaxID=59011 RepID=UPI003C2C8971
MSLDLLQGYSSPEAEEEDEDERHLSYSLSDDEDEGRNNDDDEVKSSSMRNNRSKEEKKPPPPSDSSLPSALDAFAEIAGPPEFLTNAVGGVEETREVLGVLDWRGRDRSKRDRKDLPVGAVVEAKAQLVGIRDRVRSDIGGGSTNSDSVTTASGESKRVITAANPGPKDAADLLRMCLQCGIPKTYSHTRGMVCPVCGDRPPADTTKESEKKKGSTIKDKEKSKRMRGQSSHASWKSETEMHLRQQYD